MKLQPGDSLLVVDMQEDFMEGGSLPVNGARDIVPRINRVIELFHEKGLLVFYSRDWHPENHCSFDVFGGQWPPHCVQGTRGAQFAKGLLVSKEAMVVSKGIRRDEDAYSAFKGTFLSARLRSYGVERMFVAGVATDYCVKESVLDALEIGIETILLLDCTAWVAEETGRKALEEMERSGAKFISCSDLH